MCLGLVGFGLRLGLVGFGSCLSLVGFGLCLGLVGFGLRLGPVGLGLCLGLVGFGLRLGTFGLGTFGLGLCLGLFGFGLRLGLFGLGLCLGMFGLGLCLGLGFSLAGVGRCNLARGRPQVGDHADHDVVAACLDAIVRGLPQRQDDACPRTAPFIFTDVRADQSDGVGARIHGNLDFAQADSAQVDHHACRLLELPGRESGSR